MQPGRGFDSEKVGRRNIPQSVGTQEKVPLLEKGNVNGVGCHQVDESQGILSFVFWQNKVGGAQKKGTPRPTFYPAPRTRSKEILKVVQVLGGGENRLGPAEPHQPETKGRGRVKA